MNKLLVVVDYQQDFVSGALGFAGAQALEQPILCRVQKTLAEGGKVLFTRDTHTADYLSTREGAFLPVPHCIEGTPGWHLEGELAAYEQGVPGTALLDKPTFGAANIADAVRELCGGEPDEIELCGVVTSICVVSNAVLLHSSFLNARITLLASLSAAPDPADQAAAERLLRGMGYGIEP